MAKTMNELLDIINATDPESGEEFLKLLQPEKYDRYEMGSMLEAALGNDLTCYYDKQDIDNYLNFLIKHDDIDIEVKEYIRSNRSEIIEGCYKDFDSQRPIYIHGTVDGYIESALDLGYNLTDIVGDGDLDPDIDEDGNVRFIANEVEEEDDFDEDPDSYEDDDD